MIAEIIDKTVPVVFCTSNTFVMPTCVAIRSMLECSMDAHCDIYILHPSDFTQNNTNALKRVVEGFDACINFCSMGDEFSGSHSDHGIAISSYYRLLIPWVLKDLDKVLYCDGDIIFKQSVSKIFSQDIGDNYIGAVLCEKNPNGISYIKKLNLNPNEYFNSGVLLINSKLQRGSDLKEKFMLLSRNKYEFMDQDILNIACVGKVFFMPFNMNVRSHVNPCTMSNDPSYYNHINPDINKVRDLLSNPIIIHYTGAKPWNRFTYFWYEWWNVYQRTNVFDPALEKTIWDGTYNRPISFYQMLLFFLRLSYSRLYKVIKNKVR